MRAEEPIPSTLSAERTGLDSAEGNDLGSESDLWRLLGRLDEGVALCRAGRVVRANARFAALLGRPLDLLEGLSLEEGFEDLGHGLPSLEADCPVECGIRGIESANRSVHLARVPLGGNSGQGDEAWIIQDRGHARSVEGELLRVSCELREANQERLALAQRSAAQRAEQDELLAVISHELRTPITVIVGYNRLLLSEEAGSLSDEQRRFLLDSKKSCERLNRFIGSLVDGTRVQGGSEPQRVEGSLEELIRGVLGFLRPLLQERDLDVKLALDPAASRACFDATRIEQVLTNLLGNALKYARRGGSVEVSTATLMAGPDPYVEVAVSDDGPGIPADDRERIFEPYVRIGAAAGGLGLGLAICRRIVASHGGAITVREREGGGARFAFTLPAQLSAREVSA